MMKASRLFSGEDRKKIEDAIAEAERKTSGEIVPVVATASGRYDRAEDIFGLVFAVIALCVVWLIYGAVAPAKQWTPSGGVSLGPGWAVVTVVAGFIVGAAAATLVPALKLPFISKDEMREEVERSAAEAFHKFRLRRTEGATGILIYVSLLERTARVLGDDAISEKLTQRQWDEVCAAITGGLKDGRPADGFINAVRKSGELLAANFPASLSDKNELANNIRFVD